MERKALFFDVDGTLISEMTKQVPRSAALALKKARKLGHMVFINTGRCFCYLEDIKGAVEADGYLCGCGTYIRVHDRVLYSKTIPHERGVQIKQDIIRYGLDGILEGAEGCYAQKNLSRMPEVERIKRLVGESGAITLKGWDEDDYDYDKFCVVADEKSDREGFFKSLKPDIDVIDRGGDFYECIPAGHSKATGIELVLEQLDIPLHNAYAFGDSTNDLAMLQYAGHAIVMGKHDQELRSCATFLTKTVEDDGVAFAMEQLGII